MAEKLFILSKKKRKNKSYRSLCYKKIHKRQSDRKGRYTLAHF